MTEGGITSRTRPGSITIIPEGSDGRWDVAGSIEVSHVYLPASRLQPIADLLAKGQRIELLDRVVNVSSGAGSLTLNSDPTFPYRSAFGVGYSASRTALNAITLSFALELESTRIKVNTVCPGFTATDLNNFEGTRTVEHAARVPVRLALLDANGPTGTFSNEDGPFPW